MNSCPTICPSLRPPGLASAAGALEVTEALAMGVVEPPGLLVGVWLVRGATLVPGPGAPALQPTHSNTTSNGVTCFGIGTITAPWAVVCRNHAVAVWRMGAASVRCVAAYGKTLIAHGRCAPLTWRIRDHDDSEQ